MTGFEEVVRQASEDVEQAVGHHGACASESLLAYLDGQQRFLASLRKELAGLEAHLEPLDLEVERARSGVRRLVARCLRALLDLGGLGKHLGASQRQANRATLGALQLLQERLLEQDRALAELARELGPGPTGSAVDDAQA